MENKHIDTEKSKESGHLISGRRQFLNTAIKSIAVLFGFNIITSSQFFLGKKVSLIEEAHANKSNNLPNNNSSASGQCSSSSNCGGSGGNGQCSSSSDCGGSGGSGQCSSSSDCAGGSN